MATSVVMPKLGTTMQEGTIVEWHKAEGDYVEQGEILLTIESNKAEVEVESVATGYLVKIIKEEDEEADVNEVIGVIADSMDEDVSEFL